MAVPLIAGAVLGGIASTALRGLAGGLGRGLLRGLRSDDQDVEIRIDVRTNHKDVVRWLTDIERRQLPFATAKALTDTAKKLREELRGEIDSVFDRPTPWIRRSPFMEPATKSYLVATVGIRDQGSSVTPAHYLKEYFEGAARSNKPMEKAMRAAGILTSGWLVVPGAGIKKDAFGNVSRATVARVIRELQGGGRKNTADGTFRLFVVKSGETNRRTRHLTPGIWSTSKVGDKATITPAFLFIKRATYRKEMDLPRLARKVVDRDFDRNFDAALARAIRTAR